MANDVNFTRTTIDEFEYEVTPFVVNNRVLVWDYNAKQLIVYDEKNAFSKRIPINSGQGPGEMRVLSNVIFFSDKYYLWDRLQRRFAIYNKNWKFIEMKSYFRMSNAFPMYIDSSSVIFKRSHFSSELGKRSVNRCVSSFDIEMNEVQIVCSSEFFAINGRLNLDRSIMVSVINQNKLYFADNNKYEIRSIDLENPSKPSCLFISKMIKQIPWEESMEKIRWEVLKKPQNSLPEIFPDYLPPIYDVACSDVMFAVVLNTGVLERETDIDLYHLNGKFIGKLKIPIIWNQYVSLFPTDFYFPTGFGIKGNDVITIVYNAERDIYEIEKWKIIL
jgi:hypothetical protein